MGASLRETGSRASTEPSCTVSALTGFDPARKEDLYAIQRDVEQRARELKSGITAAKALHWLVSYGLNPFYGSGYGQNFGGYEEAKPYIAAATEALAKQLSDKAIELARHDLEVAYASGTEARRAETPQSGSVHDGPTAEGGDAQ